MLRKYELRNMGGEGLGGALVLILSFSRIQNFEVGRCELAELGLAEN